MKTILIINNQDIDPGAPFVDTRIFRNRKAARAVVFDNTGKIALLKVGLYKYHKLPGGGIEEGEDVQTALERELLEEIGCKAEVTSEIGEIIEYRDQFELKQTSYCFIAKQIGIKGEPNFTEKELREQFSIVWVSDIHAAISLLEQDLPTNYEGKFIQRRDLTSLKTARDQMSM
ncbi:NUDIX domain-containing protein [Candidatus Saccharibacteria bacterium]|jgi:8-oxo-dGTP pyrophosphatase MutT (NUDIX family)|nr:NUDIX domain-containing protein [Candidatus Saccharibacteria bacterium]